MTSPEEQFRVLNKLCKWRTFFASWQLGTRSRREGEVQAVKHHRELSILLRVEVTALTGLLLEKGVFTEQELNEAVTAEAKRLDHGYEESYPGWRSTDEGMSMKLPEAQETMRNLGFPP
jgi:hypothetical protein